ncbi:DNA polymerase III subunit alpha [Bacteroidia bacterium]|nr:DNA polymerase III subunit alpha [Bacteroidia bacterium]MDC0105073.1 DNA polymerase III subunit alpha [Bacteroidia bacterium]
MPSFSHLHCHSQFSLLDGASPIDDMFAKAKADGMRAVALTDHGNMYGAFKFVNSGERHGVKPIVGCEFYMVEDRFRRSFVGDSKDKRYHQLILAKNQKGYENLSLLCSLGYIDGLYGKFPRIDKELLKKHSEGLIATSCCIGAEIPQAILFKGEAEAEKLIKEYIQIFGEDFYIELQRHGIENIDGTGMSQEDVNQTLIRFAKKYDLKTIATNDSHYMEEEDAQPHDILLCVNTGSKLSDPKGYGKGLRFAFPNNEFFFKTQEEMGRLFADVPEALDNTNIIVDSITTPKLTRDVLLPNFIMPPEFKTQDDYLRFLTFEGAKKRYPEMTIDTEERLLFELSVIKDSGYPGYFLIVQDFTSVARDMGVSVGPGRGSAAGSAVAYCLGITNVDPIAYDLLFERFLNPERVSLPDIDIDFDDEGRQKVIDYVIDKYGKKQVAQIITYGSMAARSSIKDVGRVLDVPLQEVNKVTKAFPDHLSANLNKVLATGGVQKKLKDSMNAEQNQAAEEFRVMAEQDDEIGQMIRTAKRLEGSVRNTGIHACGVIITPDDITKYVPVTTAKDSDLLVTQFDNSVVEDAGLLKMDFLGLKTLTIIKDAIAIIKSKHDVTIISDDIPLDDKKTLELFSKGNTNGVFQFESPGMQKHLKALKPDKFEDLIAMNALYRPGPMEYIKDFVERKHGRQEIKYDLDDMEEYLKDTYGITVYQEQVMLLSQKLAGFTKGQADSLRKAMGKKKIEEMNKLFDLFIEQGKEKGHKEETLKKVWKDWEAFASYAFNKSHSTCYAYLAFHTGYLKAHYPAEFMASVLTHNMNDIKKVSFFMDECKWMGIEILGPSVNESEQKFSVNKDGAIRFGLAAIKGVGGTAAIEIIRERKENGVYTSIFEICTRANQRVVNKKSLENLAIGGAFDEFGINRSSYVTDLGQGMGVEMAIRFGNQVQNDAMNSQASLFGEAGSLKIKEPELPQIEPWSLMEKLQREKELVGIYISGHPLNNFKFEIDYFTTHTLNDLEVQNLKLEGAEIRLAGLINTVREAVSKNGKPYCIFTLEDFSGTREFAMFGERYTDNKSWIELNAQIFIVAKGEKSYRDPDKLDLNIQQMTFLEDTVANQLKKVTIDMSINDINEAMMTKLFDLVDERGKVGLCFKIKSGDKAIKASSARYKIQMDEITKGKLEDLGLNFRFN